MQTSFISTQAITSAMRQSILSMQSDLAQAQKEQATGRVADVGLSLGAQAGQTVSLRGEQAQLQTITDTNALVSTRLSTTVQALTGIQQTAQTFLNNLTTDQTGQTSAAVIQQQAQNGLQALIAGLNTTLGGQYVFSGVNTDVKPIADYFATPPSANKQAVDQAFSTAFGFSQTSASVGNITPAQMQAFLSGPFAQLFQSGPASATPPSSNWSDWSLASTKAISSRISSSELVDTSVSANQPGMQQLAMAYTMVTDLGIQNMSSSTQQVVLQAAANATGVAVQDLTNIQANIGTTQQRISNANSQMSVQMNILTTQDGNLENVDPYQTATRVNNLTTQIETAYQLTAQLQRMSLAKYLSGL
ncbi:flagellar hook-associated protein 3 FlgL [Rhizobiales bacterium GAS191]|nr:flagellar hook-associated protein 3 FlgL [Rhizobiales bacterium GAS191]